MSTSLPNSFTWPFQFWAVALWIGMLGGWSTHAYSQSPKEIPGLLDFSGHSFQDQRPVSIRAMHGFWWESLEDPQSIEATEAPNYIAVPGGWNSLVLKGANAPINSFGKGTYALNLCFDSTQRDTLALQTRVIRQAYALYLNGDLVAQQGVFYPEIIETDVIPHVVLFVPTDTVQLVMHVANSGTYKGGIVEALRLGTPESILGPMKRHRARDIFLIGGLFIIGLYHFILYMALRKNVSFLLFGLICFLFMVRTGVTGEHILVDLFPWLPYRFNHRLEFGSLYFSPLVVALFFKRAFPDEVPNWLVQVTVLITCVLGISLLMPNAYWMGFILPLCRWELLILGPCLLGFGVIRAVVRKRQGATLFLIGFVALFTAAINDLLYSQNLIDTGWMASNGLMVLILCQAAALALRLSRTYHQVEYLKDNLELEVNERTEELTAANQELSGQKELIDEHHADIESSLKYAWRIQQGILGTEHKLINLFTNAFLIFKPRSIVSGDFYWFGRLSNKKIVAVGDVTGQGVPSAFVTMMTNSFLNQIIYEHRISNPAKILTRLDERLRQVLKDHQDVHQHKGLSIGLLEVDEATSEMTFAAAGRQLLHVNATDHTLLSGEKMTLAKGETAPQVYHNHVLNWDPLDQVYLYTNGFEKQLDALGRYPFGSESFQKLLLEIAHLPLIQQKNHLARKLREWQGPQEQSDDIVIMGILL